MKVLFIAIYLNFSCQLKDLQTILANFKPCTTQIVGLPNGKIHSCRNSLKSSYMCFILANVKYLALKGPSAFPN